MKYVLKVMGLAGSIVGPDQDEVPTGVYVKHFDPEGHDGMGDVKWTPTVEDAISFDSPSGAMEFYRQTSKRRPVRPDGRPNRPLTAFTVMVEPIYDN